MHDCYGWTARDRVDDITLLPAISAPKPPSQSIAMMALPAPALDLVHRTHVNQLAHFTVVDGWDLPPLAPWDKDDITD